MPRISELTRVNEVSDGDVFPIEQASSGRSRSVAFKTIRDDISADVAAAVSVAVAAAAAAEKAAASSDAQVLRGDLADGATALKGADLVAYVAGETVRDAIAASKQFDADLSNTSDPAKGAAIVGRSTVSVTSLATLAQVPTDKALSANLASGGRSGIFYFDSANLSAEVAADTQQGIYVAPASDVTGASGAWVRQYGQAVLSGAGVSVTWFGAVADSGVTDNSPAVQAAIDFLGQAGGGRVHTPAADGGNYYFLATPHDDIACVWVHYNNITLSGDGPASYYKVTSNAHVPFHFSSEQSLVTIPSGIELENFEVYGLRISGTGVYENFGLAKGRGILFRNTKNVSVHDNLITDMSMIGICAESGDGYFRVYNNRVKDCKYTAINYNGRCYQSVIYGNVCSGSNANVNTLAIQATGPCAIYGNTIYGDVSNPATCGGIGWGEGNYDGMGSIYGNLIKHCSFGIKAVYHGACNIYGNTIINCTSQGGIVLVGSSTGSFTVASSDNLVSGNLLVNCAPYGIDCSAKDTSITGNKVRNFTAITNPSATSEPDAVVAVTTQQGVRVRAEGCSVTSNYISGCVHGLTTTITMTDGVIGGNTYKNNTFNYSLESATSGVFAASGVAIVEREQSSPSVFRERIFRSARPVQGYFDLSSEWTNPVPAIGSPVGQIVLFAKKGIAAVGEPSGETVIELDTTTGWFASATATVVGIELDNGSWHWTSITAVSSPTITIAAAIPVGRSVLPGAKVYYNSWRPLANLA